MYLMGPYWNYFGMFWISSLDLDNFGIILNIIWKISETAKNIGKLLKNAKDMARDMQEIIIDEENSNSKDDQLDTPNSKNINDLNPVKFNTNDQEIKTIPKNDIENEDNKIE